MIYISFDIGVKNLAFSILDDKDNKISIIDWKVISLAEKGEKIKGGINEISYRLYVELDNIIGELNDKGYNKISTVLIENQPSNLNGIMKTIQLLIYSYFNLLKHWDNIIEQVILISPILKLQNHTYIPTTRKNLDIDRKKLKRKEQYANNKKDGIELCEYYIKDNIELYEYFKNHKKKDDLADCLLQAISHIRKKGNKSEKVDLSDILLFLR